jgi:hypothetical protein
MKFVKKVDEANTAFIHMDISDLTLPKEVKIDITPLLDFKVETYQNVKAKANAEQWEQIFGPVHSFLNTLTKEEQVKYALLIASMHMKIIKVLSPNVQTISGSDILAVENELSSMLAQFDKDIDLFTKLYVFVETGNIPLPSFVGIGERPQDTDEMTWYRPDVAKLTAVVVLCKMLTPVFGLFITNFKHSSETDGNYKEIHAITILRDTLFGRCPEVIRKLDHYISRSINQVLNPEEDLTHVYNGFTDTMIKDQIYAQMLTRRFVVVNLFRENGNLITYVSSCARGAAATQFSKTNFTNSVMTLTYKNENATEDDGNLSNLEVESRSSTRTADYELLVKAAVIQTRKTFIETHDLDETVIAQTESYYEQNHVQLTPYNQYMLSILFGPYLCGAKSIELLDAKGLVTLISLMQVYLVNQGYFDLVLAVSAVPTGQLKTFLTGADTTLKSTWNSSADFRNCNSRFPTVCNNITWYTGLENAVKNFISEVYHINVAPSIWEKLNAENRNDEIFDVPESLARLTSSFIMQHYAM